MVLVDSVPNGYVLRRIDAPPTVPAMFVPTDELADAVAALLDETLEIYTTTWETMRIATERRCMQGT